MSEKTPLGIPILDEALGGGIPRGFVLLVKVDTGTRLDALISTYLASGLKQGEPAYILCTDYPLQFSFQQLKEKGIDVDAALEAKQLIGIDAFTDAFGWGEFEPGSEYTVQDLTNSRQVHDIIQKAVLDLQPKNNLRAVVDSLTSIIAATDDYRETINYIHYQMAAQKNHGTILIYTIHPGSHSEEIVSRLEHIVDGIIALYKIYHGTGWKIALQIEKMRGIDFEPVLYEYIIKEGEITLRPFEEEEEEEEAEEEEEEEEEEEAEEEVIEGELGEEPELSTEPRFEETPEPVPSPLFEPEPTPPPEPEYVPIPEPETPPVSHPPPPSPKPPEEETPTDLAFEILEEEEQPEKPEKDKKEEEDEEDTTESGKTFFF